jgi:hypothetical protein
VLGWLCPVVLRRLPAIRGEPLRFLRPYGRLVLLEDVGRDAAAVLDLDALSLGPLANLGGVDGGAAASAAGRGSGRAAGRRACARYCPSAVRSSSVCAALRSISYSIPARPTAPIPTLNQAVHDRCRGRIWYQFGSVLIQRRAGQCRPDRLQARLRATELSRAM